MHCRDRSRCTTRSLDGCRSCLRRASFRGREVASWSAMYEHVPYILIERTERLVLRLLCKGGRQAVEAPLLLPLAMPRSDYPPRDGYILTKDEEDAIGSAASSPPMSPRQFWRRQGMGLGGKETNKRWQYTVAGVVALLLIYWMATPSTPADPWSVVESKRQTGPRASYWDVREKPKVYEAKDVSRI